MSERSSQRPELSNSTSKLEILFWNVDIVLKSNTMTRLNVTYVDTIHSSHSESCDSWQFIPFREPITIIVLKECHIKPHAFPPFTPSCFSIPAITSVRRDFCQASPRSSYLLYHPLLQYLFFRLCPSHLPFFLIALFNGRTSCVALLNPPVWRSSIMLFGVIHELWYHAPNYPLALTWHIVYSVWEKII